MSAKSEPETCRRGPGPLDIELPRTLPIFPLSGVLLLPRGRLPLNIFEPRYLAMVEDVMRDHRMIGMIQPEEGQPCPQGEPKVYPLGCAGCITAYAETGDGRYLITLTGISRFAVARELDGSHGYRQVEADWAPYAADLQDEEQGKVDRGRLLAALRGYFKANGFSVDWGALEAAPDERLITSLAMICPFHPWEKQALLAATDLTERAKLLIALVEMAILGDGSGCATQHRH